jgi:DNA polymerase-4
VKARTVQLKLRYSDFQTLQRSRSLTATGSELELYHVVLGLFRKARTRKSAIRLLGVCLSNLEPAERQLCLFDEGRTLQRAMDGIRQRYGYGAVHRALTEADEREDD